MYYNTKKNSNQQTKRKNISRYKLALDIYFI